MTGIHMFSYPTTLYIEGFARSPSRPPTTSRSKCVLSGSLQFSPPRGLASRSALNAIGQRGLPRPRPSARLGTLFLDGRTRDFYTIPFKQTGLRLLCVFGKQRRKLNMDNCSPVPSKLEDEEQRAQGLISAPSQALILAGLSPFSVRSVFYLSSTSWEIQY